MFKSKLTVGDTAPKFFSVLHGFLQRYKMEYLEYNDCAKLCEAHEPDELVRISDIQGDGSHSICCGGKHFSIWQEITKLPVTQFHPLEWKMVVEKVGDCDGACKNATVVTIAYLWKHFRAHNFLRVIGAVVPVPKGVVLYQRISQTEIVGGRSGAYVSHHNAGSFVPRSLMTEYEVLAHGEKIRTTETKWYRSARPVDTHYTYTNDHGVLVKTYAGGG